MPVRVEDRRSALARIVTAGLGLLGAALAALVGVVAAPRTTAAARQWRRAVSLFDLPPDQPMTAVLTERHADGWYDTTRQTVVFIDRDGDNYRALSSVCQHLGCRVRWDQPKQQFLCPCHGGVYDRSGRVVSGPPPRPLDRLNVRVNRETSEIEVQL